jgi:hypothetical protein
MPASFTIQQGGAPELWVDVLGFDVIRVGRPQVYVLTYGNKGNMDASVGHFWVSFPSALTWNLNFGPPPTATKVLSNGNVLLGFDIAPLPPGSNGTILFSLQTPRVYTTPFQLRVWTNQP